MEITLKSEIFHVTNDPIDQARKVVEEATEALEAVTDYEYKNGSLDHVAEEIIDVLQATLNLAFLYMPNNEALQTLYNAQFASKSERPEWKQALGGHHERTCGNCERFNRQYGGGYFCEKKLEHVEPQQSACRLWERG